MSRPARFCLQEKTFEITAPAASAEIQKWLQRAEDCYLTAQANGDAKSAVSAISTAVRGLTQLEKQIAKELEQQKAAGKPGELSIATLDQVVSAYIAEVEAERDVCLR